MERFLKNLSYTKNQQFFEDFTQKNVKFLGLRTRVRIKGVLQSFFEYLKKIIILALKFILKTTFFDILVCLLIICKKRLLMQYHQYRHSTKNFYILNLNQHKA